MCQGVRDQCTEEAGQQGPLLGPRLTIFPVLEGGGELFGSDPGNTCFLLGLLGCCKGCLGLGPGVGCPGEKQV